MEENLDHLSVEEIQEHIKELEAVLAYYRKYLTLKRPLSSKQIRVVRPHEFKEFAKLLRREKQQVKDDGEERPRKLWAV